MIVRVETVLKDIYNNDVLSIIEDDKQRGCAIGTLGRLRNEPAIGEHQPRHSKDKYLLKIGVTPSERLEALKKLFLIFLPYAETEEIKPMFEAVDMELKEYWNVDMLVVIRKKEEAAAKAEAQKKRDRMRYEKKRRERELQHELTVPEEATEEVTGEVTDKVVVDSF